MSAADSAGATAPRAEDAAAESLALWFITTTWGLGGVHFGFEVKEIWEP